MQPSLFNTRVPLTGGDGVFLMNTFTDAQLVVSPEVVALLDRLDADRCTDRSFDDAERAALEQLSRHGFVVDDRQAERDALEKYFDDHRNNTEEMHLTVLTTLQCNFACDYCLQGDHGDYNTHATKMSMETAEGVVRWLEERLDAIRPTRLALTFFGGEPLLNLPVMYELAARAWAETERRGVQLEINIITNGLLLTTEVVERLKPYGLNGIKVTLDGDQRPTTACVRCGEDRAHSTGSSTTCDGSPVSATSRSEAISMSSRSTAIQHYSIS